MIAMVVGVCTTADYNLYGTFHYVVSINRDELQLTILLYLCIGLAGQLEGTMLNPDREYAILYAPPLYIEGRAPSGQSTQPANTNFPALPASISVEWSPNVRLIYRFDSFEQ